MNDALLSRSVVLSAIPERKGKGVSNAAFCTATMIAERIRNLPVVDELPVSKRLKAALEKIQVLETEISNKEVIIENLKSAIEQHEELPKV